MPDTDTRTVQERLVQLREQATEAGDRLNGLRARPRDEMTPDWRGDMQNTILQLQSLDGEIQVFERMAGERPAHGPTAAFDAPGAGEYRSPGLQVIEKLDSPEFRGQLHVANSNAEGGIPVSMAGFRALVDTGASSGGAFLPKGQPVAPRPRQQQYAVRDLLAVQGTTLASIPYIQETSALANETGAATVSEGTSKPEATMAFALTDAPVRKIATWIPVTSEAVSDGPTLRGYIDTRLLYMLLVRENDQLLLGTGTAPQVLGLVAAANGGKQTQASIGVGFKADTLAAAAGKVENVDGQVDGIAMNPLDFWSMIAFRPPSTSNPFDGAYAGGGAGFPFASAVPPSVFGMPVVRTRALAAGSAVVASWQMGATLFDREEGYVKVADQHSDWAIYNKMALIAEERVALAIHRPDFFCLATLT